MFTRIYKNFIYLGLSTIFWNFSDYVIVQRSFYVGEDIFDIFLNKLELFIKKMQKILLTQKKQPNLKSLLWTQFWIFWAETLRMLMAWHTEQVSKFSAKSKEIKFRSCPLYREPLTLYRDINTFFTPSQISQKWNKMYMDWPQKKIFQFLCKIHK